MFQLLNLIWIVHHLPNDPKISLIERFELFLIKLIRKKRYVSFEWKNLTKEQKLKYKENGFTKKEFEDACNVVNDPNQS